MWERDAALALSDELIAIMEKLKRIPQTQREEQKISDEELDLLLSDIRRAQQIVDELIKTLKGTS